MNTLYTEFEKFHKALMSNAPEGYVPWYFPVKANGKDPDARAIAKRAPSGAVNPGSWKAQHARLTYNDAVTRLMQGGNIGFSSRDGQPIVIIDADHPDIREQLKPTLQTVSRSRIGGHGIYFTNDLRLNTNIPTDKGEIRSCDQYIVAPGSYVPTTTNEINNAYEHGIITLELKNRILVDPQLGVYTIESAIPPTMITFEEIPKIFQERYDENQKLIQNPKVQKTYAPIAAQGNRSAVFDLSIQDLVSFPGGGRYPHPLHESDTNANFSVSGGLAHCWRHMVSLNPIQFLVAKSGYMNCEDAGTPHKNTSGSSRIVGDDGAIFHAWLEAKKIGVISQDDPIPVRAMCFIALKHQLCSLKIIPERGSDKILPVSVYNAVIEVVEGKY